MPSFKDTCKHCGKEFKNHLYDPLKYCCLGCEVDAFLEHAKEDCEFYKMTGTMCENCIKEEKK